MELQDVSDIDLPKFFNFTYVPTTEGQMFLIPYNHHDGDDEKLVLKIIGMDDSVGLSGDKTLLLCPTIIHFV